MKKLFTIDLKDYHLSSQRYVRPSARAIIIKDNKVALVYSKKYGYYKFPGGGIKENEDHIVALVREVKEEVGLIVKKDSIKEFGSVLRVQKSPKNLIFYQENFYYLCDVLDEVSKQDLDEYEQEEGFLLVYENPIVAAKNNYGLKLDTFYQTMIERDAKVLELLVNEGKIKL